MHLGLKKTNLTVYLKGHTYTDTGYLKTEEFSNGLN
jgi:hypothetical protein